MLNRVAVFPTAPVAAFLTLLLELFLSFGIGKAKEQLDTVVLDVGRMVLLDDMFGNLSCFESGQSQIGNLRCCNKMEYLAKPTSLLTPDGTSRQILVEMAR